MIREYILRFENDDMVLDLKVPPADFIEIARQKDSCECGDVALCAEQIERIQLLAEADYGSWLPWTFFPDDELLICRTGLVH